MSTYVVNVPAPAVGHDWRYTIPGQYLATLIGVTATLTTTADPTVFADASGNGHDAPINVHTSYTLDTAGPFGGGAGNAGVTQADAPPNGTQILAQAPGSAAFGAAQFTCDFWTKFTQSPALGFISTFHGVRIGSAGQARWSVGQNNNAGNPINPIVTETGVIKFAFAGALSAGAWHHVAVTWDGATWTLYVDGTSVATHAGDGPGAGAGDAFTLCGTPDGVRCPAGSHASVAYYPSALSGATIAAHAAASGSQAAYQAAVLASSPVAYWPMNEPISKTSRHANFTATDGTTTFFSIPAGFTTTNAGVFQWSWQTLGQGSAQSADGSTAAVTIPAMTLAPGNTIGTVTPDLAATDQWSNIVIWFTSPEGGTVGGGDDPFIYPPGACLIIVPQGG